MATKEEYNELITCVIGTAVDALHYSQHYGKLKYDGCNIEDDEDIKKVITVHYIDLTYKKKRHVIKVQVFYDDAVTSVHKWYRDGADFGSGDWMELGVESKFPAADYIHQALTAQLEMMHNKKAKRKSKRREDIADSMVDELF